VTLGSRRPRSLISRSTGMVTADHPRGGAGQPPGRADAPNRWRRCNGWNQPTRTQSASSWCGALKKHCGGGGGSGDGPRIRSPNTCQGSAAGARPATTACVLAPEPPEPEPKPLLQTHPCHAASAAAGPGEAGIWQPRLGLRLSPASNPRCPSPATHRLSLSTVEADPALKQAGDAARRSEAGGCWAIGPGARPPHDCFPRRLRTSPVICPPLKRALL